MDSALRPRDIQARIRAGESPDDVAAAAGVPVERIDAFAAPVLAERDHIAGLARTHPVRRRGETASHRLLRTAIGEYLQPRGVDADTVAWDAWKLEDRRWRVRARFEADGERVADFTYDQSGRFAVAANDAARVIVGELVPAHEGDAPADDQLALVRALQSSAPEASPDSDSGPVATVTPLAHAPARDAVTDSSVDPTTGPEPTPPPQAAAREPAAGAESDGAESDGAESDGAESDGAEPDGAEVDLEDAYFEAELTEVDGVVEIVPASDTDLDVLYDMLSSFDEDSVKIYAGLVHPIQDSLPVVDAEPQSETPQHSEHPGDTTPEPAQPDVAAEDQMPQGVPAPEPTQPDVAAEDQTPEGVPAPEPDSAAPQQHEPFVPAPTEPEQLSLIDDDVAPPPPPKPRRKRASVPSWDEIVFGGPTTPRDG